MEPVPDLLRWLQNVCPHLPMQITPLIAHAGNRRYFRIDCHDHSFIAMDASLAKESCKPYAALAYELRNIGVETPAVFAADFNKGYMLISYFGDQTYLSVLNANNADRLYQQAANTLALMQTCRHVTNWQLPPFDQGWLWQEWDWHKEWFLHKLLGLQQDGEQARLLNQCYSQLVASALTQPQTFMHRDYHSANLMVLPNEKVGVLDFQDAFIGPVTYDAVSLLRDCYIDWPLDKVMQWALDYCRLLHTKHILCGVDDTLFLRWFDWMGIERHLKALFTFARKYVRDQDARYLCHMERTLNYVLQVSHRYAALSNLFDYYSVIVQPVLTKKLAVLCAR